jgi:hypothetical protein
MTIQVTAEHIRKGSICSSASCPIALAISAALLTPCSVLHHSVSLYGDYQRHVNLPQSCADFINAFDTERPVSPFTFELELN